MKLFITLLLLGALTARSTYRWKAIKCNIAKNASCPLSTRPVCGFNANGLTSGYANNCNACTTYDIVGYIPASCLDIAPGSVDFSDFYPKQQTKSSGRSRGRGGRSKVSPSRPRVQTVINVSSSGALFVCTTRSKACTRQYNPVCATKNDGSRSTYATACTACADESVKGYTTGQCRAVSVPNINAPPPANNQAQTAPQAAPQVVQQPTRQAPSADSLLEIPNNDIDGPSTDSIIRVPQINAPPPAAGSAFQEVCLTRTPACTREFRQVCGRKRDGSSQTYNNKCLACADANVVSFSQRACSSTQAPPSNPPAALNPPQADLNRPLAACIGPAPPVCSLLLAPVCARMRDGSLRNFSNNCTACAQGSAGFWSGTCPPANTQPIPQTPPPSSGSQVCLSRAPLCTRELIEVCGKKNDGTLKTYGNKCTACADTSVVSYTQGACPVPPSGNQVCLSRSPLCTRQYVPVCGQKTDGSSQTYGNKCTACADSNVASYSQGACPAASPPAQPPASLTPPPADLTKTISSCLGFGPVCTMIYAPVCAKLQDGKLKEFGSNCTACGQGAIGFWSGTCPEGATVAPTIPPGGIPAGVTPCLSRSQVCTYIYLPVCGKRVNGSQQTYPSDCTACADSQVYGYVRDPCPEAPAEPTPPAVPSGPLKNCNGIPTICPFLLMPVCGKNIVGQWTQYDNSCQACKNKLLAGFVDGKCPTGSSASTTSIALRPPSADSAGPSVDSGFGGLKNCGAYPAACPFNINPVCGRTITGQQIQSDNACLACQNKLLAGYTEGPCASQNRPQVKPLAPPLKNCNETPKACPFILNPVCGKTIIGEWKEYDNQCLACQNKVLAGYIDGKCPAGSTSASTTSISFGPSRGADSVGPSADSVGPSVDSGFNGPLLQNCGGSQARCPFNINPVCGRTTSGNWIQYDNACLACQNKLLGGYTQGPCTSQNRPPPPIQSNPPAAQLKNCNGVPTGCTFILSPVCGKSILGEWKQYGNNCTACQNKSLAGYTDGPCPAGLVPSAPAKPNRGPQEQCPSRNSVCGYNLNPVCAVTLAKVETTYDNSCLACQNPLTVGFYKGSC